MDGSKRRPWMARAKDASLRAPGRNERRSAGQEAARPTKTGSSKKKMDIGVDMFQRLEIPAAGPERRMGGLLVGGLNWIEALQFVERGLTIELAQFATSSERHDVAAKLGHDGPVAFRRGVPCQRQLQGCAERP